MSDPRVIVALDFPSTDEALGFAAIVEPGQCRLKVGIELFSIGGPAIVGALAERGFDIFLDLKFHDIPNTVARACAVAARMGAWMLNVHTLGGADMLQAAREAVDGCDQRPLLIGVTVLTSHAERDLAGVGIHGGLMHEVDVLAALARAAALDGVVCSPQEVAELRKNMGAGFVLVTPGIRPTAAAKDDQARTMAPREAVKQGADYLVIGRPITRAAKPRDVLEAINRDLEPH
ncbi:MAG: orotidine-5'-phosphate decarboxylase [Gammaproteobacteria bacterium]|nr:orotidine-5'-phosphate decarboxylase [Gammaproteobacteria bacterium]